ncbi:MAG: DEAD/DEAH box helicase [Phycisphaeraceae bacterium]|nr:MAG: DEAD/DEAH box helicase [Phycisphaeraceae bacterium]
MNKDKPNPGPEPAPAPPPLSVVTVCRNNEKTIGAVLESVRGLAGEIIAVDSGSTDRTMEICRENGAVVLEREWAGYVGTKQIALGAARLDWVLHLDSDEPVTAELSGAIRALIAADDPGIAGARVRRVVWYRGRPLEHAWQPEWRLRLVRRALVERGEAEWGGLDPHDTLEVDASAGRIVDLGGVLRHDSFETFGEHLAKQVGHARTSARSLHAAGARTNAWKLAMNPVGAFLKQIVLKQAWRDGAAGWLAAGTTAAGTLMKHMMLLEMDQTSPEGAPDAYGSTLSGRSSETHGRHRDTRAGRSGSAGQRTEPSGKAHVSEHSVEQDVGSAGGPAEPQASGEIEAKGGVSEPGEHGGDGSPDRQGDGEPRKRKRRRRRRRKPDGERAPEHESDAGDDEGDEEPAHHGLRTVVPLSEEAQKHVFNVERSFADLGLGEPLLKALGEAGWSHPTKIQGELIPISLTGRDVLGQAKTGSGKTAAFGLPILQQATPGEAMQALILAPTRELAVQIADDIASLGKHTPLKTCAIYGGQRITTQAKKLEHGPEIIVGTPGRVLDMIERRLLHLGGVKFAVLDEVDRMFDIGFRDDIKKILRKCPEKRQTIFVSATLNDEIERLARQHMRDPERLVVTSGSLTVEMVKQHHIGVQAWDKKRMLAHMLTHEEPDLTLVFCRMKRTVDDVVRYLAKKKIEAHALHGDMSQGQRNRTMRNFRHGVLNVLVASDLASRGLDVEGITHVVNYDLPEDPDIYVHRIGRTARAGREGVAWSLVTPEQGPLLTQIEVLINAEIPEREYPDFEPGEKPENWKPEPTGGRPPVEVTGVAEARNRLDDAAELPAEAKLSADELAAKFPGGVVPKKLPPKRMRGKLRTRGR